MTALAVGVLCFLVGVVVGAWLRGLIQTDSPADAGSTPTEPVLSPPAITPSIGLVQTDQSQPLSRLVDLVLVAGGQPVKTIRVNRRAHRVFYGDLGWDHFGESSTGRWLYRPTSPLTKDERKRLERQ